VNRSRPTSPSTNLMTHIKTKVEKYVRHFGISQYETFDWLRGCITANIVIGPVYFLLTNMKGFSDFK
jgi:hypothetical protein